jgi:hypothetical protein
VTEPETLAHQHLAGRHVDLVGEHAQALQPPVIEPAEERDAAQQVELFVTRQGGGLRVVEARIRRSAASVEDLRRLHGDAEADDAWDAFHERGIV